MGPRGRFYRGRLARAVCFCLEELVKEDNSPLEEGETLKFRIVDFIKYEHKVMLSHVSTYKAPSAEGQASDATNRGPVQMVKKATLSDLGALSKLKEKLTGEGEKTSEQEGAVAEGKETKGSKTKKAKEEKGGEDK